MEEEELELDDIQGAIVPGFKKDHAALLYLKINDRAGCKAWLAEEAKEVARADEVLCFNRLFRTMRARRGSEVSAPKAVWTSISFSCEGLSILRSPEEVHTAFSFCDPFHDGMYQSSLQDPPRSGWVLGGSRERSPHLLVVVAADDPDDLAREVERLHATVSPGSGRDPGLELMASPQLGTTLPDPLTGHEHFGFRDGISQPAVRGLASTDPTDFVDERRLAPSDPHYELFAEPGRPLVWPGQFLLGYRRQNRLELTESLPPFQVRVPWQRNGSFLVYRRLRQKPHLFWSFCTEQASRLTAELGRQVSPVDFATLLVGRWPSGAPLARRPDGDDPTLAADDDANNDFLFAADTPPVTLADGHIAGSAFPAAKADPNGLRCPFAAHIRKVNPRDDPSDTSGPRKTKIHLVLRRGIPYGEATAVPRPLDDDHVDRGLLFMSYQASIDAQFEFITKTWVNRANAPHDSTPNTGHDPLIGKHPDGAFVRLPIHDEQIDLPTEPWVVMTGGGYFFTPSISALSGALVE